MSTPVKLYEKIIVPVAVAGILGGLGMGLRAIIAIERFSANQAAITADLVEIREMVQEHETAIAILNDREERSGE